MPRVGFSVCSPSITASIAMARRLLFIPSRTRSSPLLLVVVVMTLLLAGGEGAAQRGNVRKLLQGTATSESVGPASTSCSATTVGAGCSPPAPGAADATAGESSPAAATAGLAGAGTSSEQYCCSWVLSVLCVFLAFVDNIDERERSILFLFLLARACVAPMVLLQPHDEYVHVVKMLAAHLGQMCGGNSK